MHIIVLHPKSVILNFFKIWTLHSEELILKKKKNFSKKICKKKGFVKTILKNYFWLFIIFGNLKTQNSVSVNVQLYDENI